MGLTITTLQDVFKNKVKDSINVPTVWIDSKTGEEHHDFKYTHISSMNPEIADASDSDSYTIETEDCPGTDILYVRGDIRQVGSHVLWVGPIAGNENEYKFPLQETFRYAKSLEEISCLFYFWEPFKEFTIPEDLLWNCPNLKEIFNLFLDAGVKKAPSNLLAKCPKLESVFGLFRNTLLDEIPEDLFKNNPRIKQFDCAFSKTYVQKVPDKLLEPFKDGIIAGTISVSDFVENTPISDKCRPNNSEATLDKYLPSYLPKKIQIDMMGFCISEE